MEITKLTEFEEEEVYELIKNGTLDIDFISKYISKVTKGYNILIDEIKKRDLEIEEIKDKRIVLNIGE